MTTLSRVALVLLCAWTIGLAQRTSERANPLASPDPTIAWKRLYFEGYTQTPSTPQGTNIEFKVSCLGANAGSLAPMIPVSAAYKIYRVTGRSRKQDGDVYMNASGLFTAGFYPLHDSQGNAIYPGDNSRFPYEYRRGCNWTTSFTLSGSTTASWPSGIYYAKLYLSGSEQDTSRMGFVPFVIRAANPGSTSKVLCVIAWNTYQAYNYWGGGSLYWWLGTFESPDRDGTTSVIDSVSFRRPFTDFRPDPYPITTQMGQVNHRERDYAAWAYETPYPMEYCVDGDVHDQGSTLLANYKDVVYAGHAEYWTNKERAAFERDQSGFKHRWGNLQFLSSNNCYWQVDYNPPTGTNNPEAMRCNKHAADGEPSLWRHQSVSSDSVGGHESRLLGVEYEGNNQSSDTTIHVRDTAYVVPDTTHWLFRGTGLQNGQEFGFGNPTGIFETNLERLVGGEADMKTGFSPPTTQVLAKRYVRQLTNDDPHRNEVSGDSLWSHMAYYEDTTTNSRVFASGAMGWCSALFGSDGPSVMQVMHRSLLDHFSGVKYIGPVYTTAANALPWTSNVLLDGNVDVLTDKYLKISSSTVTVGGTTTFAALGTVEITSGTVTLTGLNDQWGTFVIRNGGTLLVKAGATLTLEAPLYFVLQTGSHLTLESGATLTIKTNTTVGRGVNLTVPAGATLNIQVPGEIYVDKDGAVDVYGLLSAQGTDEQHVLFSSLSEVPGPGDWYGLTFHAGASGTVEKADIRYAQYGVALSSGSGAVTVRGSTLSENRYGLFASFPSSSSFIAHNTITANTDAGVSLDHTTCRLSANTITDNGPYGIQCVSQGSPDLDSNLVTGATTAGLYCYSYSAPHLGRKAYAGIYTGGYNVIRDNALGVWAVSYSNLQMGIGTYDGKNSIYRDTGYELQAEDHSTVTAEQNWWGSFPPASGEFSTTGGSTIDYSPALRSDPNSGRFLLLAQEGPAATTSSADSLELLEAAGHLQEALEGHLAALSSDPERAFYHLAKCHTLCAALGREDFLQLLSDQIQPALAARTDPALQHQLAMLRADWLTRAGRVQEALTVLKAAADDYGAASLVLRLESLLAQVLITARELGDSLQSRRLLVQARTLAPEHPQLALLEPLLPVYLRLRKQVSTPVGTQASGATASAAKTARLEAQEGEIQRSRPVPEKFLLEDGYPNPFNPSTTLRFGLPADAQVRLVIYDLLGREVAHLAEGMHQAGYHTVTWHAQQAASGCYLARLTVTGPLGKIAYVGTSKLLLTR